MLGGLDAGWVGCWVDWMPGGFDARVDLMPGGFDAGWIPCPSHYFVFQLFLIHIWPIFNFYGSSYLESRFK